MGITFEIKDKYGVIGNRKMNTMELRLVAWNGHPAKFDIRGWYMSGNEEHCTKGITLTIDEINKVAEIIDGIDFENSENVVIGTVPQNGNFEIRVLKTKWGYVIGSYNGNYSFKNVTLSADEIRRLREIIPAKKAEKVVPMPKKAVANKIAETTIEKPDDKVVKGLTTLPANDASYPKKATREQLLEAIRVMEADTKGRHKTRIAKCKSMLAKSQETAKTEPITVIKKEDEEKVIQFPKKDTEVIKKLQPTGEHHTYEETEEKLNAERKMFEGDPASSWVIDGLLELCKVDEDFRNNVMRPEKTYTGAFKYFAKKAEQGFCTRVGNVGVMSSETALKYAIDYFNLDEEK